ncbi:MAG: hypothetical protein R3B68_05810 [Phycisphaerales bacterium]
MRVPRRLLLLLAKRLALGLVSTIVVAWSLSFYLPNTMAEYRRGTVYEDFGADVISFPAASYHEVRDFGLVRRAVKRIETWAFPMSHPMALWPAVHREDLGALTVAALDGDWGEVVDAANADSVGLFPEATDDARGWPLPAFWCTHRVERVSTLKGQAFTNNIFGGVRIGRAPAWGSPGFRSDAARFRAIPLMPLWRGVLVNSALYAIAWALVLHALSVLASRRESRRGHCPQCRYDLLHDFAGGCPECGWGR